MTPKLKMKIPSISNDTKWILIWLAGISVLLVWDLVFLNKPALARVWFGFGNTLLVSVISLITALFLSFTVSSWITLSKWDGRPKLAKSGELFLNIFRSVPQIIGLLTGFLILTLLVTSEFMTGKTAILTGFGITVGVVIFYEFSDMLLERVTWFEQTDFISASRTAGVPDTHLLFIEIWFRNSRPHLINKLISGFGATIFLLCSIDFVLSVGLSSSVSPINFPPTLGSMLAQIDSKQDILSVGILLSDPLYFPSLFTRHLQGLSVAFLIVFTLACTFKMGNAFTRRHRL